jgi:signal transduction histidine kinase
MDEKKAVTELMKVLLVEDDEDDYILARRLLTAIYGERLSLDWARTYEAALEMTLTYAHDVCLLDYRLGLRSGVELLREICAENHPLPIILMTGQGDREVDLEAMNAGAADYLVKGQIDAALLERAIRYAIQQKRSEAQRVQLVREQEARAQAEEANRLKDEFLATVSHELRSPLNAIQGWAELLLDGGLDEQNATRAVETIARHTRAQNQLISDLLDVSRIITGKLHFETAPVDLAQAIEAALETVRPAAEAKGVELRQRLDPKGGLVLGDDTRLRQVVWNLLSNAIKYTPRGGHIETRLERDGAEVAIIVRDTGEGIGADFLPHIFERFRQADGATTRRHGGLGLGLAIVRHLIEAHGGRVSAASGGVGQGAILKVTLPLMVLPNADPSNAECGVRSVGSTSEQSATHNPQFAILEGVRVLVVDDESDARELLKLALVTRGAEVRVGASASDALDIMGQWRPDVFVNDIGMPDEDGYELMRKVRALPAERGGQTPAVALTGYFSVNAAKRSLAAGYQIFMPKPVNLTELATAIARLAVTDWQTAVPSPTNNPVKFNE